jgi:hypothetical protein
MTASFSTLEQAPPPDEARHAAAMAEFSEPPAEAIDAWRQALAAVPPDVQARFEPYLDHTVHALHASDGKGPTRQPGQSWANWLATSASPREVAAFAHLHSDTVELANHDPALQEAVAERKHAYADGLRQGVASRWFSGHALTVLPRLAALDVRFGDDLVDPYLQSPHQFGYYQWGGDELVLKQALHAPAAQAQAEALEIVNGHTVLHELGHARGNGLDFPRWFEEAGAEDSALVIQALNEGRHPGDLAVGEGDGHASTGYRHLRQAMLSRGRVHIHPKKFLRAWSSDGMDSTEVQELGATLDKSWGTTGALKQIDYRVQERQKELNERYKNRADWPYDRVANQAAYDVSLALERSPELVFEQATSS